MDYNDMLPHQQRVVDEQRELDIKLDSLKRFVNESPIYGKLSSSEKQRLHLQYCHMDDYSTVLHARITAFGTDE